MGVRKLRRSQCLVTHARFFFVCKFALSGTGVTVCACVHVFFGTPAHIQGRLCECDLRHVYHAAACHRRVGVLLHIMS